MAQIDIKPWLPGSMPMPEPFVWTGPGPIPADKAIPEQTATPLPIGYYTKGKPQNVINSLYACLEGENRQFEEREEYLANHAPPLPAPVTPTPVITTLVPPDAVASGSAPISLQVNGSDFQEVSKVWFNGVVMPTMYYTGAKLVAEVQKLAIGYYPVLVKTGDKISNTVQFRFR